MRPNVTAVESAFDLAKSGRCETTQDIVKVLKAEGYPTDQVVGQMLLQQLRQMIREYTRVGTSRSVRS